MPNSIKYSTSTQTQALKVGNFWIGTNDVPKGETSVTDYWNGITPPVGGYTIYLGRVTNGPVIYVAANDTELVNLTNRINGTSHTLATQSLSYYSTQTDRMVLNIDYEPIITDSLLVNYDAGFVSSYPRTGTTWIDLDGTSNGSLSNGPTWTNASGGMFTFDGVDDFMDLSAIINFNTGVAFTAEIVINIPTFVQNLSRVHWLSGVGGNSMVIIRSSQILIWNEAGGVNSATINYTFNTNTNYHVTITRDTSNLVTLYINGISVGTASRDGQFRWTTFGRLGSGTSFCSNFRVYKSAIYNKALSSSEVLQNFNAVRSRFEL